MFCKHCGKEIKDDARFCSGCGMDVQKAEPVQQQNQQQAQFVPPPTQQQPPQQQDQAPSVQQSPIQQPYQTPHAQQQYSQQQYAQYQQQPQKKSKKPLFGIAGAAAGVLVFFLAIFPMIGGGNNTGTKSGGMDVEIFVVPPGGRDVPFEPTGGGFTTNDQSIGMIEVNQCMSYGFDTNTGEYYLMENFVAGKETAVFINMEEPPDPKSEIMLTIEKNGEHVATLFPELTDDPTLLLFQPKDMSEVNYWDQGAYTFTFTMDDKYAVRETNFFKAMPLKILAVPIRANYSGQIVGCEGEWMTSGQMVPEAFPVAKADVEYVLGSELDLTDPKYDLDTQEGIYYVWEAVSNLQTPNNDYTLIIGFVREGPMNGKYRGYTYGLPANIVCEPDIDMITIVLHEISHCYKIGDEYPGGHINNILNAPPYQMEGIDIITRQPDAGNKEKVTGGRQFGLDESGSVVFEDQRAYWVEGREQLGLVTSYMGWATGCDPYDKWITSDIWNHLFKAFTGQLTGHEPGMVDPGLYFGQCYSCYGDIYDPNFYVQCLNCNIYTLVTGPSFSCEGCRTAYEFYNTYTDNDLMIECTNCLELLRVTDLEMFNTGDGTISATEESLIEVVEIKGWFETDGSFTAKPWYTYLAPPGFVTTNKDGEYSLHVYDDKGKETSVVYFNTTDNSQLTAIQGTTSIPDARIPIEIAAKFPENTTKISIMKGNKEIYSRAVSKSTPNVAFTGMDDYQDLPNKTTITWEASDADGDELHFELWYCTSNMDEYFMVASDITGRSYDVDLSDYPGSEGGYFYIYATDGVRTAEKNSPFINMPFKAPVILTEQKEVPKIKITEEIFYPIEIYDSQDGWLYGLEVEWFLDGDMSDSISVTNVFQAWPYQFEPGIHTITCIATNSGGLSVEKDFKFEILNDESDLPNDKFRQDIVYALTNGYMAPVSRIDAPITRGEYADFAFMLYYYINPDGLARYDETAIKDCGSDDYSEFFMDYLGVMKASSGYFNPQNSITQKEAMTIMYQVYMLAVNPGTTLDDLEYTEEELAEFFVSIGVFDEIGENLYSANEKLSKKLALVRSARMDMWTFNS